MQRPVGPAEVTPDFFDFAMHTQHTQHTQHHLQGAAATAPGGTSSITGTRSLELYVLLARTCLQYNPLLRPTFPEVVDDLRAVQALLRQEEREAWAREQARSAVSAGGGDHQQPPSASTNTTLVDARGTSAHHHLLTLHRTPLHANINMTDSSSSVPLATATPRLDLHLHRIPGSSCLEATAGAMPAGGGDSTAVVASAMWLPSAPNWQVVVDPELMQLGSAMGTHAADDTGGGTAGPAEAGPAGHSSSSSSSTGVINPPQHGGLHLEQPSAVAAVADAGAGGPGSQPECLVSPSGECLLLPLPAAGSTAAASDASSMGFMRGSRWKDLGGSTDSSARWGPSAGSGSSAGAFDSLVDMATAAAAANHGDANGHQGAHQQRQHVGLPSLPSWDGEARELEL